MKKILMVCEAFGGGVFTYVTQLCNDMCDDFDIYLAYALRPQTPKNYKSFLDPRVHLIKVKNWNGSSITNLINDQRVVKELRKIEDSVKPDIIHLHSSIAGGIGRIAFAGRGSKLVYTPHGYAHVLMGAGVRSKIYESVERKLGKKDCITLTCCESEDDVAKKLTGKTAYIETGVDIDDLKKKLSSIQPSPHHQFTVYTLGRACVQKQPKLFNQIAELVPEAHFVWVGSGELEKELTASNLEVTGWKPREEALAMAKAADAFILCSLGEAIAMSLIENMFIKNLCLVSDVMGNKSVINDGVNGYVCKKAEDFAARIRESMHHFPSQLPNQAYADVKNIYNTKIMKYKYVRFYSSLI